MVSTNAFIQRMNSVVFPVTMRQPMVKLHLSVYKPHTTRSSLIRSEEGLSLETTAFESLYSGQFTLSTQLIKPNYLVILPTKQHHSFFRNLPSVSKWQYMCLIMILKVL